MICVIKIIIYLTYFYQKQLVKCKFDQHLFSFFQVMLMWSSSYGHCAVYKDTNKWFLRY